MRCISANPVVCPVLNQGNKSNTLQAQVSTFEDGSSEVACTAKDTDHPAKCTIDGEICALQREAKQEVCTLLTMNLVAKLEGGKMREVLDAAREIAIRNALQKTDYRAGKAAQLLDMSRQSFDDHRWRLNILKK